MSNTNDDKGLFWNSVGDDRLYDADSMGKWLSTFFTGGVRAGQCNVTASGTNMDVTMSPGYVNIVNPSSSSPGGKVRLFEEAVTLTVNTADSVNPRIDTLVVERNDNNREITVKIIDGTPAATPTAAAPVRTASIYQLVLAEIRVNAGAITINNSNITNKKTDNSVCGIVTGAVANNQIIYSDQDLEPGVSELADGTVYFVYE